jgi:hypothetical protein
MNTELQRTLEKMSGAEKAELMEALWEDMLHCSESLPSISWHKRILDERRQAVLRGEAKYSSLEDAKKELLDRFS